MHSYPIIPRWSFRGACVAFLAGLVACSTAGAAVTAYQLNAPPAPGNQTGFAGTFGQDFTVNSAVSVSALGAFDSNGDGISGTVTTVLYQKTGDNAGTEVPGGRLSFTGSSDRLEFGYRFRDLAAALTLQPGTYTIASYGYTTEPLGNENNSAVEARHTDTGGGLITYSQKGTTLTRLPRFNGTANTYPSSPGPFGSSTQQEYLFLGPNFQFQAVPEPTTLGLLTAGGLLLMRRGRRDAVAG